MVKTRVLERAPLTQGILKDQDDEVPIGNDQKEDNI